MIRTICKPDAPQISLPIPTEYVGEEVEILVFPVCEASVKSFSDGPAVRKTPVFGCLRGQIHMASDFDAPLEDFKAYM
jgi:hypothetical protein